MSAESGAAESLAEKLGSARNLIACAWIAAGDESHMEGVFPVRTTLLVALDKVDDVLEVLTSRIDAESAQGGG